MKKFPELKTLPTQEEIEQLKQRNAELEAQLVEVNNNRTGVSPCARFCEALAAKKMFDNLQTRNAELMAQVQRFYEFVNFVVNCCEMSKDHFDYGTKLLSDFIEVKSTPAQCLAERDREVAARVLNSAIDNLAAVGIDGHYLVKTVDIYEYANKIKSGEVEV